MLHGSTPFDDAINPMDLLHKIKKRRIEYNKNLSWLCTNLISGLLTIKPSSRMGWNEFFEHGWLKDIEDSDYESDSEVFSEFKLNIIDDYKPPISNPVEISRNKDSAYSNINYYSPKSVPMQNNFTNNFVSYMTSSVGSAVRGTFNYLSQ